MFLNAGPMFHIGNFQFFGIAAFLHAGTNVVISRVDRRRGAGHARRGALYARLLDAADDHQMVELNQDAGHWNCGA